MARSKGSGCLVKRGDVWYMRVMVDGKVVSKSTGLTSKVEAKRMLDDFTRPFKARSSIEMLENIESRIRAVEQDAAETTDDLSNVELGDMLERYLKLANVKAISENTERSYRMLVEKFASFTSKNFPTVGRMRDVSKPVAEAWLASIKDSSAGGYNNALALFKKIWNEFGNVSVHRCFKENPWNGFKYKNADQSVKRPLTQDEVRRVLEAANGDARLLFKIGLYTGLRVGDCATLEWEEVDMERRLITTEPDKTKRYHTKVVIPIHPDLYAELESVRMALPEEGCSKYVSKKLARRYENGHIDELTKPVFKNAGIETSAVIDGKKRTVVSFHSLRHTFVSMAASNGVPLEVIRQITGHTSTDMTMHYSHASMESLESAVNSIPSMEAKVSAKSLVEVDTSLIKALNAIGTSVEEALKEYISDRLNTITIDVKEPAA